MKPIVLAISLITLVGCVESDPFGTAYLMVNNQTNESLSITFKVCYDNVDTITKCIPPQTIDTIYESDFIGSFFLSGKLKTFRIATCDNPTHVLYKQEPINESAWIVDEKYTKKGFCYFSSNTFVVTDELLNQ